MKDQTDVGKLRRRLVAERAGVKCPRVGGQARQEGGCSRFSLARKCLAKIVKRMHGYQVITIQQATLSVLCGVSIFFARLLGLFR